jgi:aspartyl/asparaginyl-tRNA synthetase
MELGIFDKGSANLRKIEVIKIRASILKFIRNWLDKNGYLEIPTPVIVKDPMETQLSFKLDY